MLAHHNRGAHVHIRQIFLQPIELILLHACRVVTRAHHSGVVAAAGVFVFVEHIVEHHIVHFAEVERIVVRADDFAPRLARLEVGGSTLVRRGVGHGWVVVVVTDYGEKYDGIAVSLLVGNEVFQIVFFGIPVVVPSEVAKHDGIDTLSSSLSRFFLLFQRGDITFLIHGAVFVAVSQVRVGTENHQVVVVVHLVECEVVGFGGTDIGRRQLLPKFRNEIVGSGRLVSSWKRVEHISVFLLAGETVVAVGIGQRHYISIAHGHALHASTVASDTSVDVLCIARRSCRRCGNHC